MKRFVPLILAAVAMMIFLIGCGGTSSNGGGSIQSQLRGEFDHHSRAAKKCNVDGFMGLYNVDYVNDANEQDYYSLREATAELFSYGYPVTIKLGCENAYEQNSEAFCEGDIKMSCHGYSTDGYYAYRWVPRWSVIEQLAGRSKTPTKTLTLMMRDLANQLKADGVKKNPDPIPFEP